jgi:tetratricopeptide (TPR) repeat protein
VITYALVVLLAAAQAASRDSLLAQGDRLAALEPASALIRFEAILASDSTDVGANWRAALALNDLALPLGRKDARPRRDSLLARAQERARRAVRLAPGNARALFALGLVLGNTALSRGIRGRVRLAGEIRELALRAIAADSALDGPHHLLGRWNYEVLQLSGFERFIARSLLGGGVLGEASWPEARRELEQAVALDSTRIYHRLDLARVYLARKDTRAAESQLQEIGRLPVRVAADSTYRREARELLERIAGGTRTSGSP